MRLLLPLLAVLACRSQEPAAAPDPVDLPDVVLVTLDTTRADRLGAYGYAEARTETLDALAAGGRRYVHAWSPVPFTIPSHAAILTGLYPARLGIRDNGSAVLEQSRTTLPEILREHGYRTAGSVSAFVTTRQWGFSQGFDAFFDEVPQEEPGRNFWHAERPADAVVGDALAWKAAQDGEAPLFLWVHLYDPHFPFSPPPEYRQEPPRPYDGELAFVDDQVARLLAAWPAGDPPLVAVLADHGEGLGDHGELNHGLYVYDATQRVPFLLNGPGVEVAAVQEPVSVVDLVPTLLDLLGLPVPDGLDGRVTHASEPRPIHLESHHLTSRYGIAPHVGVVDGTLKLIDLPRPELYDLAADPGEQRDLAASRPADVARLQERLAAFGFRPPDRSDADALDPEVARQLEQLGYLQGSFRGPTDGVLPDPKDRAALLAKVARLDGLTRRGDRDELLALLRELVEAYPEQLALRARYAGALVEAGRSEEALALAEAIHAEDPGEMRATTLLAGLYAENDRWREAAELYRAAAEAAPYAPNFRMMAVLSLLRTAGARDEAVALARHYLEDHPDDVMVAGLLGVELAHAGEVAEAVPLLELAATADRPPLDVLRLLAGPALASGDLLAARVLLERELDLHPLNDKALWTLYRLYAEVEDWEAEVGVVDRLLALKGDDPRLWHAKAQALFNLRDFAGSRAALTEGLSRAPDDPNLLLLDANLLVEEGKPEAGAARFEEAKAARAAQARSTGDN